VPGANFQKSMGVKYFKSIFCIIYILIYFDAYKLRKCTQNGELAAENMKT
jgi:hypothetical protein